jgi:polyferredoxin
MTAKKGTIFQRVRIIFQILFLVLFFFLLFRTGSVSPSHIEFYHAFFNFDPLILLTYLLATMKLMPSLMLALIPFLLTFFFGRFFCGWVCPFGAIHQFFTWLARKPARKKVAADRRLLRIKYVLLIVLLVASLFGTQLVGWLDPFSFLTRSSAVAVLPGMNFLLQHALQVGAGDTGIVARAAKPVYEFGRKTVLSGKQRTFAQPLLIGLALMLVVSLNFYRRRFFCNSLCPLGAFFGVFARYSLIRLRTTDGCKGCNACASHCTYYGSPYQDYWKSECMLCFNCVADCPHSTIAVDMAPPVRANRPAVDIGRRRVLASFGSGLALAAFPAVSVFQKSKFHGFIRPPGSVREKDFLKKCIRCGECMQACPTNAIQPALLQAGTQGIWTPVLVPVNGYCEYECNRCTRVCPTEAIEKIGLEEKKKFKIGTAVINRSLCYTYADGYDCAVCEEHCPVPEKAIKFRSVDVFNFKGKLKKVNQIYVVPDLCIGCGICENVCPRIDSPAIYVGAEEEQRETEG